jgi:hypothetical protein
MTDIEQRLNNWRLCFKDKPHYKRTASLEGNYKPPPVWEAPSIKIPIDLNDALVIEKAVTALPDKHKMVLVVSTMYPYLLINSAFYKTCHIIGISRRPEVFDDYLKKSKIMLANILHSRESERTLTKNIAAQLLNDATECQMVG